MFRYQWTLDKVKEAKIQIGEVETRLIQQKPGERQLPSVHSKAAATTVASQDIWPKTVEQRKLTFLRHTWAMPMLSWTRKKTCVECNLPSKEIALTS